MEIVVGYLRILCVVEGSMPLLTLVGILMLVSVYELSIASMQVSRYAAQAAGRMLLVMIAAEALWILLVATA